MNINFAEMLEQGAQAVKITVKNKDEIGHVFADFQQSIADFLNIDIMLYDDTEFEEHIDPIRKTQALVFGESRKPTGYKLLSIKAGHVTLHKSLFKYKEDPDGYPVVINYTHQRYICNTQSELVNALGLIASDPQIHLIFNEFKQQYATTTKKP